jgi:subtilisin-like proprotein convertase family protein
VAGLIAAERNGIGGVGVAYDALLTGINIFDPYSGGGTNPGIYVNADDRTLFYDAMRMTNRFDVVNHSWGMTVPAYGSDFSRSVAGTDAYKLTEALASAVEGGRGGLGTIQIFAAGNNSLDASGESTHTDRHFINVGAYRQVDGLASNYSSRGDSLLISAPSNDFTILGGTGIVTTDLKGRDGYNYSDDPGGSRNYTDSFGGTSAATPIASGVVTLMLDANDQLGWRDVQNILANSAKLPIAWDNHTRYLAYEDEFGGGTARMNEDQFRVVGPNNTSWNGGGLHYSSDYGYGAVDAYAAVRMAEVWSRFGPAQASANEAHVQTMTFSPELTNPVFNDYDFTTAWSSFAGHQVGYSFDVGAVDLDVEHIDLTIDYTSLIDFSQYGLEGLFEYNLSATRLKLTAPDGTFAFVDTLQSGAPYSMAEQQYVFGFQNFRGADLSGTWTLEIEGAGGSVTTIHDFKLDFYGSAPANDNLYTYTNEFLTMAGLDGQAGRTSLFDGNGGIDWINAAAVTSNVTLSLVRGSTVMFGTDTAFTIKSGTIENVVTGDGADHLQGNRLSNDLVGMRGDDVLIGGRGDDRLEGGAGHDTFVLAVKLDTGHDTVVDFTHDDALAFTRNMGGTVAVGSDGLILIDGAADGDSVALGTGHPDSLRFLGEADGLFYYGEDLAPVAGSGQTVVEGTFGNDVLGGAKGTDVFFFDTTGAFGTGADVVKNFGGKDLLVTTSAVDGADAGGVVHLDPAGFLDLPGQGGSVTFTGTTPTAFELDGTVQHDGQTYFVYSLVGSAVGTADLTF